MILDLIMILSVGVAITSFSLCIIMILARIFIWLKDKIKQLRKPNKHIATSQETFNPLDAVNPDDVLETNLSMEMLKEKNIQYEFNNGSKISLYDAMKCRGTRAFSKKTRIEQFHEDDIKDLFELYNAGAIANIETGRMSHNNGARSSLSREKMALINSLGGWKRAEDVLRGMMVAAHNKRVIKELGYGE